MFIINIYLMINNLSFFFKYYNELDDDLKNLILSKIRWPQNKALLDDIVSYKKHKDIIYDKYVINGFEYTDDYGDYFNIYRNIENDLLDYYNNNVEYMDNNNYIKIVESNIRKLSRQVCYKIKKEKRGVSCVLYNYHLNNNISAITKINRYIGNLTINERKDFISKIKKNNYINFI